MIPDEEGVLSCELGVQFMLRNRVDPLFCVIVVKIQPQYLEEHGLAELLDLAVEHVLEEVDTVGMHRLVFTDSRFNKHVIFTSEIQAISVLAPDKLPGDDEENVT
jgi:hypothetical protein